MSDIGIYIHVPFCGKKCGYCDFYSQKYSRDGADAYVQAVLRNIDHYGASGADVDTIYFGGGTPSLLSPEQLMLIIERIRSRFRVNENCEITLEANPSGLFPERLRKLRETGINRLSLGVQSMVDSELRFLGRNHSSDRAERAVLDAAGAGFENISCDLMLAIPEQTIASLEISAKLLARLPITHISAYILKVEAGTPFDCDEIRSAVPDDETSADFYLHMVSVLESLGFRQYEVSNFAVSGYESRHNCRYWNCRDYIGIGPSAHSCFGGKRFAAESSLDEFIRSEIQPIYVTDESPCGFEEYAMLRLRLREGLDLRNIGEKRTYIEKKLQPLISSGYINFDGDVISLTPKGFLMSNSVIEHIIF
ncbi:MAG: radical SAM family heme chaperone HemW [Ruminococcus sp.]|nr:radical SAM family heme chaperone HemW [Ruminococcus sp.]